MKIKLLTLLALFCVPVFTAQAQINTQALQACSLIENDFNRLLCYDNIMAGKAIEKANKVETMTAPAAKKPASNATDIAIANKSNTEKPADDFGLEHKEIAKDKATEIKATVTSVKQAPYGELIINLDNGQQWRQIGSDRMRLNKNDDIEISRGVFNSFLLKKIGNNRSIRVKRTQ
jgi:hypothetical protein